MPEAASRRALISLGSNIQPETHLPLAVEALARRLDVVAASSLYETEPLGAPGTPSFLNAAVSLDTTLGPAELKFDVLRPLEAEMGRVRGDDPNAPRVIDLDLSLFGDLVVEDPGRGLVLPDPEVLTAAHVILPLAEIAATQVHPVDGRTLGEIAAPFRGTRSVVAVARVDLPSSRGGGRVGNR